ncbi:SLC13 family permease [Phytoactinopolyspora endophytica]|uniref:GntT/GntP/DsdX family permease n=1 Tax=Phytoactinopolyspora endophytica TaxID=1642495 RepID=UPI00197C4C07|nr:SLC13 family permease [Phytoactinopolyspora endophytica]
MTTVAIAVAAIALLLFLVMKLKLPAFIALLLVAVATAIATGMQLDEIIPTVIDGMGGTLGNVALLVGLGAMLGSVIEKTGGAEALAERFIQKLGRERVGPALLLASAIVAIPIFFDVGFIVLLPIMFSFAKAAGHRSPVFVGVPIAGLMVYIHNTVPPHPGVTGSSTLLGADIGLVTILGILISAPLGVLAYYTGKRITSRREFPIEAVVRERFDQTVERDDDEARGGASSRGGAGGGSSSGPGAAGGGPSSTDGMMGGTAVAVATGQRTKPGPGAVATMILLPIVLIAIGTVGGLRLDEDTDAARVVSLIGQPAFALLVALTLAVYVLGSRHGWGRQELGDMMNASLGPAAIVVFVTGAGGVFATVLTESGIGETVSDLLVDSGVPILLMAFLLATVFKVAQGSGTVATLASAGLLQSAIAQGDYSSMQIALIVLAVGCGSVALSHINDSGFWIASRFLGLSVADGLRTWTVLTTVLGWAGMIIITALWLLVS